MSRINVRIDDLLIFLISEYHRHTNSEIINFFFEICLNAIKCDPNIKCRPTDTDRKIHVVRGFYPGSSIPFKISIVSFASYGVSSCRVKLGGKENYSSINNKEVKEYMDNTINEIILGEDAHEHEVINCNRFKWKCMRPSGIKLFKKSRLK
jgi:hypothetical protein